MRNILASFLFMTVALLSCSKSNTQDTGAMTEMTVEFDNIAGGQNLFLNTVTYRNGAGEDFTVSNLRYFVSNFKLWKTDGTLYEVLQDSSYFLINESDVNSRFARFKVPVGDYSRLEFVLGVDSLRSTMDVSRRTGVLDPSGGHDGMYWGWNSGYIFFKMEGTSPSVPVDPTGARMWRYHIGGFGGYSAPTINNIRTISTNLTASGVVQARAGRRANVHYFVDVMKMFNGNTQVSLAANPSVMFSEFSARVANNFQEMFYHDHTEN